MKRKFALLAATIASLGSVAPVNAATLLFNLTGSRTATFQLDSNPTPTTFSDSSLIGAQIQFANVSGAFGGVAGSAPLITFGNGLVTTFEIVGVPSLGFSQFNGPAIFTGTANAPIFALGTFSLTSIVSGASTLTISEVTAAVPEPATWLMMILGFAMVGAGLRYGQQTTTVKFALAR